MQYLHEGILDCEEAHILQTTGMHHPNLQLACGMRHAVPQFSELCAQTQVVGLPFFLEFRILL